MDLDHAKFGLHQEVQSLAKELNIRQPQLSAFILSITKQQDLINANHLKMSDFTERHILFIDSHQVYLKQMFKMMLEEQ